MAGRVTRNCEASGPRPHVGIVEVRAVSRPFDAGRVVEVKFEGATPDCFEGEVYMRVPAARAGAFKIGEQYALKLERFE